MRYYISIVIFRWFRLMRLSVSRTKNACSYYIIDSFRGLDGKVKTKIIEKLGTEKHIKETYGVEDAELWCRQYLETKKAEEERIKSKSCRTISIKLAENLPKDEKALTYNAGYLVLEKIYHEFGIANICSEIQAKHPHVKGFSLNKVLKAMLFGRVLSPSSKLSLSNKVQHQMLECPNVQVQHIYRAMDLIAEHYDLIQDRLYYYSNKTLKRNVNRLYYDCTNFFTEKELEDCDVKGKSEEWYQEHTLRKYGKSKENRPNPIVQLGLFMDGDGVPLGINVFAGNESEKPSMKPLEKKLIKNFSKTDIVVCADCGLSTFDNRQFNNCTIETDPLVQFGLRGQRHYVYVQSIKQLKANLQEWALDPNAWTYIDRSSGKPVTVNNFSLDNLNEDNRDEFYNVSFYKERTIAENGLDQRLIVTFSLKYQDYMRALRERKIKRAQKMIETSSYKQEHENSPRSLLTQEHQTKDGKKATKTTAKINQEKIDKDTKFDGFYCNATNLFKEECSTQQIAAIGARRWEIKEYFRIMKTNLKSRPFYHNKDSRIIAHFIICFMTLVLIRGLERKIALQAGPHDRYPNGKYTVDELLQAIKDIELVSVSQGQAFMPSYNNSEIISELLKIFDMEQFGQQVVMKDTLKNILKKIKEDPEMYQEDKKAS